METAEIDERVGAQEEVGDDGSNGIQFRCRDGGKRRGAFICAYYSEHRNLTIKKQQLRELSTESPTRGYRLVEFYLSAILS